MKVAITGAYSSGKTTLVRLVCQELSSRGVAVSVIPDVARGCPLPLNTEQTIWSSAWLLGTQICAEAERSQARDDLILCDRCVVDVLAHTKLIDVPGEQRATLGAFSAAAAEWVRTYDVLFIARPDTALPVDPDGLRVPSKRYQRDLDAAAQEVLRELAHPRAVELPTCTEARLHLVLTSLLADRAPY